MARQARQESSTGFYHVMIRGINREYLFRRDADKAHFMELLHAQQNTAFLLVAWCIMDNHAHLLIKAEKDTMSKAIKVISLKFAAHYNRALDRIGPVFGDRFRSESIEDESYLVGVLRYIHHNPLKAGLVSNISSYPWSSYQEYLGNVRYINEDQKKFILDILGGSTGYISLHAKDDDTIYLETPEDIEKYKLAKAARVIESFCQQNGVIYAKEIASRPELFAELCEQLVNGVGLTLRTAAALLETSHHRVHYALRDE